jgi:hypothetical protein
MAKHADWLLTELRRVAAVVRWQPRAKGTARILPMPLPSVFLTGPCVPALKLAFFHDRLREWRYAAIATELNGQGMEGRTTVAEVALRLGRDPDELEWLMANPDAWNLED